ncbi:potassium channel family protein [Puniceicoccus vermicola]|uniref:TrkA family potassium uptake protein n=1 Tax=Puniceicoccus vermicola TaxID=388746 RepID=A0A7X1AYR1_9BACT|nr:TrkA family potassium uptake protein [Puniceicoccus vermicola]MBC2602244.1 TrkA family potassium uptake protein [Puniceicoccus vermicola]
MTMKFAVIGLGQFGYHLAIELASEGHEVIAVDILERQIDAIRDQVAHAVIADATDSKAMEQLSLHDLDGVCVTTGENLATSLEITGILQEMGIGKLYCRVLSPMHERILRLMKVEHIVQAEALAASQLAKRMGIRGATRHFSLTEEFSIVELEVPPFFVGKKLSEADLRGKYGINLVTVKRPVPDKDHEMLGIPSPDHVFQENEALVVFGLEEAIKAFSGRKR